MLSYLNGTEPGTEGNCDLALRALELRAGAATQNLHGMRMAALFLAPSLRTRTSLQAAASALSIHPIILQPGADTWPLEFRDGAVMDGEAVEHVADAVRVLSTYTDLIGVRAFAALEDADTDRSDPILSAVARYAGVPVLNLESARWHPLQGLADTATLMSHFGPDLSGHRLTLSWAPHPEALPASVPNQTLISSVLQGMDVTVAHPPGFDLDPQIVEQAHALATRSGGSVTVTHDQADALRGSRVVVAKSWAGFSGYGRRDDERAARKDLSHWRIDPDKLATTDGAGFMHSLPLRRNIVATDAVVDGPNCWVYEQAGLRLWTTMAVLERMLLNGDTDRWVVNDDN